MVVTDKELRLLASASGINEKGVLRLLGSIRVAPQKTPDAPPYELGLRLIRGRSPIVGIDYDPDGKTVAALKEYQRVCPKTAGWLGRGDFDPTKVPPTLTEGNILHASRTAGRIRARLMRELKSLV